MRASRGTAAEENVIRITMVKREDHLRTLYYINVLEWWFSVEAVSDRSLLCCVVLVFPPDRKKRSRPVL